MENLVYKQFTPTQELVLKLNIIILSIFGLSLSFYCYISPNGNSFNNFIMFIVPMFVIYNLSRCNALFNKKDKNEKLTVDEGEYLFVNSAMSCCLLFMATLYLIYGNIEFHLLRLLIIPLGLYIIYNAIIVIKTKIGESVI